MDPNNQSQPPATPPPLQGVSKHREEDMLEPGENVLLVVRRSLVGLIAIYLVAIIAVVAIISLVVVTSPDTFKTSSPTIASSLSVLIVISAIFMVLILFAATYVYRQSKLLITDRSLVQVIQKTLFNRKVSRLSMSNVEDVNEEQRGLISSLFNYGSLTVQTAGTQDNFIFTMCPKPAALADQIIEARQAYAKSVQEDQEKR